MRILLTSFLVLLTAGMLHAQPLNGTYTVGSGSGDDYASLHAAITALNTEGMSGDVQLLITTDLDEGQNIFLGLDTDGHTLTIRPAAGTTPTITFTATATNSAINGALVIGANSDDWDSLVETRNVIIDGSNTVGGSSRDLTLTTLSSTGSSNYVRLLGTARDVTLRNTNISMNQNSFEVVLISPLNRGGTEWVPQEVTLENNLLQTNPAQSSSRAVNVWAVSGTGFDDVVTAPGPIHIIGNDIEARRYGIWLRSATGNTVIRGNTIAINETAALASYGIRTEASVTDDIDIEISGNAITRLTGGGIVKGMSLVASGRYMIFNNTVTGFEPNSPAAEGIEFYGIHVETPPLPETINVQLLHNTVFMNPVGTPGLPAWRYRGIQSNSNARITVNLENNIVINADDSDAASFAYYQFGVASTITSDHNNFFVANTSGSNNNLGRFSGSGGSDLADLAAWQSATELDANSTSVDVVFADDVTLRPDGSMFTVTALHAPFNEFVEFDIAGTERSAPVFKGAWQVADPTSTSIDQLAVDQPAAVTLHANFPNPFNPSTTIAFTLADAGMVELEVFSADGRRVQTLISRNMPAGTHQVTFRADQLSSGVYLYRLKAGGVTQARTMTLIK